LLGETNTEVCRYDGFLKGIPNPGILLLQLVKKEDGLFPKIENTQSTMSEVLERGAGENEKKKIGVLAAREYNYGRIKLVNGRLYQT
jgi:hypothetical protein